MKKYLMPIICVIVLFTGILIMLYPSVSNYWNTRHQSHAIAAYTGDVRSVTDDLYQEMWDQAKAYNRALLRKGGARVMEKHELEEYNRLLNPGNNGVMGYLELPSIKVSMPVYHGTDEAVLQIAAGHVEWSSLPVGGKSTHTVLSGHRGLPSARLFTDLDQMKEGDLIILRIMDEKLVYEVDQILVVEPGQTEALMIKEGEDLCTLVTCTPYGINSHRLLIRGKRTSQECTE